VTIHTVARTVLVVDDHAAFRAAARHLLELDRLGRVVVLLEIRDEDVGALARERERDRAADAAIAARDERDPVQELARPLVRLLAVVGPRLHLRLAAGRGLRLLGEGRLRAGVLGVLGLRREPRLPARAGRKT